MELGLSEFDFWRMTLREVRRYADARIAQIKRENTQQAFFDYNLANLIGVSVGRLFSKSASFPSLHEAYPMYFEEEELTAEQRDEISAIRFMQFANDFNQRFSEENN